MPPRGGNHAIRELWKLINDVSTHAPARGQSAFHSCSFVTMMCFNSCPREGAIRKPPVRIKSPLLFQLMPPRGGNQSTFCAVAILPEVSTHAPARGQSPRRLVRVFYPECFNSCPREGAICTHVYLIKKSILCFNSCPREGAIISLDI